MDQNLIDESLWVLREAYAEFKNLAILWSTGKDSTTSLALCREAFLGKVPFPVIHIDTGYKFPEMYSFRDNLSKEWDLHLVIAKSTKFGKVKPEEGKFECCTELKTRALLDCVKKNGFDALILSIRRDEHGIRGKERVFSPRESNMNWMYKNQPLEAWNIYQKLEERGHTRVHPILHWTELDTWEYIKENKLPCNPMYFSGYVKPGERYRSLGCQPCTNPIRSDADTIDKIVEELKVTKISERSGRAQDKESAFTMQKLRALGYM